MRFRFRLVCAALLLTFVASVRAADPVWIEITSPNFVLFTDTSEVKGRRLVEDFERRLAAMSSALGGIPSRQFPVEVFLFGKKEDFLQVAPRPTGPEAPPEFEKSAFLVRGPDRVFVGARDKAPEDIADDVGHALGHVFFERLVLWRPFWLNEGAAEYFRKAGRGPDTKRIEEKDGYPVADLLEIKQSRDFNDDAPRNAFRIQSHRLLRIVASEHGPALRDFLKALRTDSAAEPKMNVDAKALQTRFDAYVETRLDLGSATAEIKLQPASAESIGIHRGDFLLAANLTSEASEWYRGDGRESRVARAILTRFSRGGGEPLRVLDRTTRDFPDAGLALFHLGSVETKEPADLEIQVRALQRATELLPRFGRAHGQLARVLSQLGRAEDAMKEIDRAIDLEPEYADDFYVLKSEVFLDLKQYAEASAAIQFAASLPHANRSVDYNFKISEMQRRVEQVRRDADNRRLQQLRAEVAADVARKDPPPPPPPPVERTPDRTGSIQYNVQSSRQTAIVNAPLPVYDRALVQKGTAGNITVQLTVGGDGKVTKAAIVTSQLQEMNDATLDAVKKWTFTPGAAGSTSFDARVVFRFSIQ